MANRDCAEIARRVIRNIRKKMRAGNYPLAKARFAMQAWLLHCSSVPRVRYQGVAAAFQIRLVDVQGVGL